MGPFTAFRVYTVILLAYGILGQVTPPLPTTEALGDDVSLTCTSTESNPTFIWTFTSDDVLSQTLFLGDIDTAGPIRYNNIVLRDSANVQTSILGINAIELEEEGEYQCSTAAAITTPPTTAVTVEVGSASQPISLDSPPDYTEYIATCNAIGSKPGETITWILDDVIQTDGIVPTGPTERGDSLFDTTSVFTFPATVDNYKVTLECVIGGHQVDKLNRNETRLVDIHNPPKAEGITIGLNNVGTDLKVTCIINNAVDATIPPMGSFYIYSNGTLVTKPVSANSVTVPEPDYDTEYMCVGGNYLGNTSTTEIFCPRRATVTPSTTEEFHPSRSTTGSEIETTPEPTPCPCAPSGLSSGASAGISILAILLVASITINIVQFNILRRKTKQDVDDSTKNNKRDELNIPQEVNDNVAYEMIQSGDRAYTALQLDSSHSFAIRRENVTFFTRLGSIGRGDFGEVWKGDLRSKQKHLDVVIRQIPDRVTKSGQVLQGIKILYKLSDQTNIVKCLGYCSEQGSILYEFISGGTLLTHLQTSGVQSQPMYSNLKPNDVRIDEGTLLNLAWQVAKGMQFLASKKIIHGSLCAHNVLLGERKQCKISDYGLSSSFFGDVAKPTRWSSPETMATGDKTTEGDIWSFGIVLWEIVTLGARPYPNMTFSTVQTEVAKGYQMPCPRHCAQEVYVVMTGCWDKEPPNRSNFDHILRSMDSILEKKHGYLSLNNLDERLYASTLDM
ncbi:angiopoietin-1 receptor-like [Lytechinus variegatus]|uniref:angiopoietin-1 receptor-like n=1 Tax=Lytechinus variegatus TaxID=7654 RepID=UPI001BB2B652|nr:angiopoietin-1 receptor-like [Lytechinus variegatus]